MAAVTSIILVKSFPYRDSTAEEFSNRYYFRSLPPGDNASWVILADDLARLEKAVFPPTVKYTHAYGYNDDAANAQAVFDHDFTQETNPPIGTYLSAEEPCAGDQAAFIWYRTNRKNSRGKWIYLRKYFHGCTVDAANRDKIDAAHFTAYMTLVNELHPAAGAFHGGIRSRTHADDMLASGVGEWVTTRTLKRRGKRPLKAA
jgi:hypothetical protein